MFSRMLTLIATLVLTQPGSTASLIPEVLFSQGVSAEFQDPTGSAWSDFDPGNGGASYAASRFSIAGDSRITSVEFEGRYVNDGVFNGVDDFSIAVMALDGSKPGLVILPSTKGTLTMRSVVGTGLSGSFTVDYYKYRLDLPAGLSLVAGDYWLSVANDTEAANSPNEWVWHYSGAESGSRAFSTTSQTTGYSGPFAADLVFSLSGTPIPEPSVAFLGALGVMTLLLRGRCRA